ncbi:MAG: hypothetical protein ACLUA4_05250 [Bifidobacterium sp.]
MTSADGNTRPSVVQGAKLALKAVATHVDKTTVDVTGQATFKSKDAGVATVEEARSPPSRPEARGSTPPMTA